MKVGCILQVESKYQWRQAPQIGDIKGLMRSLYRGRGVTNNQQAKDYLYPQGQSVYSPWLLHDMDKAVARIRRAIDNQEMITIYGDYDADGITSTSLLYETLRDLGANAYYYVPDRFRDGYGPNADAYQRIVSQGTQLIITVDNGVSGKDVIDPVVQSGVDVVITDHHELPDQLPQLATAIVHPAYPDSGYPFTGLSGVGVAFKLAWALTGQFPLNKLDLVAIGEIADVVPVNDENRYLIQTGLKVLSQTQRYGLQMLIENAGLTGRELNSVDVGFNIAPRLNALGRIGNASDGVTLLTSYDHDELNQLVTKVEDLNTRRKNLVSQIYDQAQAQVEDNQNQALIVAGHGWHQGVLGIVASRIMDDTGKPTLVVSNNDGVSVAKGSGRSRDGFDLYQALMPHQDLMVSFGGHPQACGLSVDESQIQQLQVAFNQEALKQGFNANQKPKLGVDVVVPAQLVNQRHVVDLIQKLQPYGPGNLQPEIEINNVVADNFFQMGDHHQHLKFRLNGLTCVMFNVDPHLMDDLIDKPLDVVGKLSLNYWRGKVTVQLLVDDLRESK